MAKPYCVALIQSNLNVVNIAEEKEEIIQKNISRDLELIDFACEDVRFGKTELVVFPEFFLTGVPEERTWEGYMMRSIKVPGKETDLFAERAREHKVYVVGGVFERDDDWPDRCFNTAFIIDPNGEIILKYRKHNDTQVCVNTNPGDMYTAYVEKYGEDALFPVVDTPLGKLACITCYDIDFPEVARILALNGAEVLLMPTGDPFAISSQHELFRRARALENTAYVISTNHGKTLNSLRPESQQRGYSQIIGYNGEVVACIDGTGESVIWGMIDIESLRQRRTSIDANNFLACFRGSLYAKYYAKADCWPLDRWNEKPKKNKEEAFALSQEVIDKYYQNGIWVKPGSR
jgi:predicted amidohydrolase